jgi:hypothetical protein
LLNLHTHSESAFRDVSKLMDARTKPSTAAHMQMQTPEQIPCVVQGCRLVPVPRAPLNVFAYHTDTPEAPCGESTKCVGWKNIFSMPVDYDVLLTPRLFDTSNSDLVPCTGPRRRFLVIGTAR